MDRRGLRRRNATHESTGDPEAWRYRESANAGAILWYFGHVETKNQEGLVVNARTGEGAVDGQPFEGRPEGRELREEMSIAQIADSSSLALSSNYPAPVFVGQMFVAH